MARFLEIPPTRLAPDVLVALLEEFASRDGTDYGEQELSLEVKISQLRRLLQAGELCLLYDSDSETWDLLPRDRALLLLAEAPL